MNTIEIGDWTFDIYYIVAISDPKLNVESKSYVGLEVYLKNSFKPIMVRILEDNPDLCYDDAMKYKNDIVKKIKGD